MCIRDRAVPAWYGDSVQYKVFLDVCSCIWFQKLPECLEKKYGNTNKYYNQQQMHEKRQKTWALQHCPTQPGAVLQWDEYDNSTETSFMQNLLAFGTKSCLRMGLINYINTENTINGSNCIKNIDQGQYHYSNSTGAVLGTGLGNLSYFGLAIWEN